MSSQLAAGWKSDGFSCSAEVHFRFAADFGMCDTGVDDRTVPLAQHPTVSTSMAFSLAG